MKQLKFKGFTLIELLIVVAIIAILAAIAVPNFLEAQVRSKVSRAKTDMRTLATALETYFVDNNTYVGSAGFDSRVTPMTPGLTVNQTLNKGVPALNNAAGRITFRAHRAAAADGKAQSMTTPIAYLTSLSNDPFADTRGSTFGYFNAADAGWITWSYGPDTDEKTGNGQIETKIRTLEWPNATTCTFDSFYSPQQSNPSADLKCGTANATYDPTNGTNSKGDVWRVKE